MSLWKKRAAADGDNDCSPPEGSVAKVMLTTVLSRRRACHDENGRRTQDDYLTNQDPQRRIEQPCDHRCRDDDNDRRPLRFAVNAAVAVPVVDQGPENPVFSQPTIQPL